jgi:DNA-binding PadR family transcriptional regulator
MWWKRSSPAVLGEFEQLVLLAVLRLDDEGYGASIQREIEERTRRPVSLNAAYTTLDRLERKRLVRSWIGEPTAQRGGRRRKHYALEPRGLAAIRFAYQSFRLMTAGLERRLEGA